VHHGRHGLRVRVNPAAIGFRVHRVHPITICVLVFVSGLILTAAIGTKKHHEHAHCIREVASCMVEQARQLTPQRRTVAHLENRGLRFTLTRGRFTWGGAAYIKDLSMFTMADTAPHDCVTSRQRVCYPLRWRWDVASPLHGCSSRGLYTKLVMVAAIGT